ncbi:MAG: hypothetical protein U5O39_11670 [Gammaproteobacteria bacterium]|nr:hypothetical protein [Gammaproteobacteria bacterium]
MKAKNLTTQLLTFSRRQSMDSQWVSLNELVTEVQGMLSRLIPATVNVKLELNDALPGIMVTADSSSSSSSTCASMPAMRWPVAVS